VEYFTPVLDLPAVYMLLRLHGVAKSDWPELVRLWGLAHWATHRTWKKEDVDGLMASGSGTEA